MLPWKSPLDEVLQFRFCPDDVVSLCLQFIKGVFLHQRYSPILADRWACGRMIEHFAKYIPTNEGAPKKGYRAFARRLLDVNARARPDLNKLEAIHGSRKRKAAESLPEPAPKRRAVDWCVVYLLIYSSHMTDLCMRGSQVQDRKRLAVSRLLSLKSPEAEG